MYLYFGNVNFMIKLKTPQEMADNANNIDYGLHNDEHRISLWAYIVHKLRKEFKLTFKL